MHLLYWRLHSQSFSILTCCCESDGGGQFCDRRKADSWSHSRPAFLLHWHYRAGTAKGTDPPETKTSRRDLQTLSRGCWSAESMEHIIQLQMHTANDLNPLLFWGCSLAYSMPGQQMVKRHPTYICSPNLIAATKCLTLYADIKVSLSPRNVCF